MLLNFSVVATDYLTLDERQCLNPPNRVSTNQQILSVNRMEASANDGRLTAIFPQFEAVDDVLPEHITTCAHGGDRIKIGISHPDTKGRILLEQGLSTIYLIPQMTANAAAHQEENETKDETHRGNHEQHRQSGFAMHDIPHSNARGNAELHGPEIEREVGDGHNPGTDTLGKVLHISAESQRGNQHHRPLQALPLPQGR